MDISTLQSLEAQGAHAKIELALSQSTGTLQSPQVLQYATQYYVRRGKPDKVLTYYSQYVQTSTEGNRDLNAVGMAIECAQKLGKHSLTQDYFFALSNSEREALPPQALLHVCEAFLALGKINEAEKVCGFLRKRSGLNALPNFDSMIQSRFGSAVGVRKFIENTKPSFTKARKDESINTAISLAMAHMAEGNFRAALDVLTQCKSAVTLC